MNADKYMRMTAHVEHAIQTINSLVSRIKELEQENEDLKGQLRQFGLGLPRGAKKGLFLK